MYSLFDSNKSKEEVSGFTVNVKITAALVSSKRYDDRGVELRVCQLAFCAQIVF